MQIFVQGQISIYELVFSERSAASDRALRQFFCGLLLVACFLWLIAVDECASRQSQSAAPLFLRSFFYSFSEVSYILYVGIVVDYSNSFFVSHLLVK